VDLANTVMVVREGGEAVDLLADEAQMRRWLAYERERLGGAELELGVRASLGCASCATRCGTSSRRAQRVSHWLWRPSRA